jgi:hypothetical protein
MKCCVSEENLHVGLALLTTGTIAFVVYELYAWLFNSVF